MTADAQRSDDWKSAGLLAGWREEPAVLMSNFAANAIAYLPALTLPWVIGALIEHERLSGSTAGLIASLQMGGLAAITALCGGFTHRFDRLHVVVLGAVISLFTMIALAWSPSHILLIALPLCGIGFGMCSAGGNAITAASRDPARMSARSWMLMMPWQMLVWAVAPVLEGLWGLSGLFALQAGGIALMLAILVGLRIVSSGIPPIVRRDYPGVRIRLPLLPLALVVVCTVAFWLRDATTWSLLERRGAALHVDPPMLATALSIGTIIGLAGPASTIWLGMRFGRLWTIAGSQALAALVFMLIALVADPILYCVAFLFWSGTSIFAWTYLIEMTVAIDPSGRLSGICSGLVFGAGALGPLLGGVILDNGNPAALPVTMGLLSIATVGGAVAAAKRLSGTARSSADAKGGG